MFRRMLSLIAGVLLSAASAAMAQEKAAAPHVSAADSKAQAIQLDVVSIKPAKPGENWHFGWGATGFSAAGQSLGSLIYQAYFPMNMAPKDAVVGAPDWVDKELWDVEAKVTPEDMDAYQKHRPRFDDGPDAMGKRLLQSMLADRFHLVVHTVPAEVDGYALVVAKGGPKMKEAAPDEAQPSGGIPMAGGGWLIPYKRGEYPHAQYFGVTMSTFAIQERGVGAAVVDRTGLTGRYDFTLNWFSSGPDEKHVGAIEFDDPEKLSHWDFGALGLRAEHVKLPSVRIVIDHVEQPTPN